MDRGSVCGASGRSLGRCRSDRNRNNRGNRADGRKDTGMNGKGIRLSPSSKATGLHRAFDPFTPTRPDLSPPPSALLSACSSYLDRVDHRAHLALDVARVPGEVLLHTDWARHLREVR